MPRNLPTTNHWLITEFADYQADYSHESKYNAMKALNRLHGWLADKGIELVSTEDEPNAGPAPTHLRAFLTWRGEQLNHLTGEPLSPATVLSDHRYMRAFYRFASTDLEGFGAHAIRNPMLAVKQPEQRKPDAAKLVYAEQWEYEAFLDTCRGKTLDQRERAMNRRDAAIITVMWHTGARRSEVAKLRRRDVDLDAGTLHFFETKARSGADARTVALPREAMRILRHYLRQRGDDPGPLWLSMRRDRSGARRGIAPNSIYLMLKRRAIKANTTMTNLPAPLRPPVHAFRRGLAVRWQLNGFPDAALKRQMGWGDDSPMPGRYAKLAMDEIAAHHAIALAQLPAPPPRRGRKTIVARHLRAVEESA